MAGIPLLIAVMAANPERICPHLHISMQSGSEAVLRRMRRRWGARAAMAMVADRLTPHMAKSDHVALLNNLFIAEDGDAVVEPFRPEPLPSRRSLYGSAAREAARERGA